jgi:hypothetical protein
VIAVPGGWAALGSFDQRNFAAWRSRDGVHWRLTRRLASTPSNSFSSVSSIVRRGTALVASGSSGQHAAAWVSPDVGSSWRRVRAKALEVNGAVIASTVVGSVVVLVGARGTGQTSPAWIMRDLTHVDPAVVPRTHGVQDSIAGITDLGGRLLAVGAAAQQPAAWLSLDRGASWKRMPIAVTPGVGGALQQVVSLRGHLVASGVEYRAGDDGPAAFVWQAGAGGRSWQPVPRGSGSFGDGRGTRVWQLVALRNAAVMIGVAHDRADPNFCYDDRATCDQQSATLWLSTDGRTWGRVAVDGTTRSDRFSTAAVDAAGLLVVGSRFDATEGSSTTRVWRWTGPASALPVSVVPPEQRPMTPRHDLIDRYDAHIQVGRTYRFPVPMGASCGGGRLYFNSTTWQVVQPWGDAPFPKSWPVRHVPVSDGPTDYLYGTVRIVDDHHLLVGIEDGPPLRSYAPTTEHQPICA